MSSVQWHMKRLTEQFRREIAWAIERRLSDPRVPKFVTVSEINLAPDTRNATVYISIFDENSDPKETIKALNHAAPFIQKCISPRIKIKNFPKLLFRLDTSYEKSQKIQTILEQIKDDLA